MSRYRQTISEALQQVNENSLIIKAKAIAKKFADSMTKAVAEIEKLEKGLSKNPAVDAELRKYNEEVSLDKNLNEFKKMTVSFKTHDMMSKASTDLSKQGFTISGNQKALKVNGNGADLNKYATDLQNNYGATVRAESYTIDESADEDSYNPITEACWVGYKQVGMKDKGGKQVPNCVKEDVSLDEASLKDIFTANQEGKKVEDIAKKLNMSVADVKKILGEETLHEFTDAQISQLKKEYEPLKGKTISGPNATKLMKIFDKFEKNKQLLVKILKADIPFVSMLAQARLIRVHGANSSQLAQMRKEEIEEIEEKAGVEIAKIRADRDEKDDKEVATKEKENDSLKDQVAMLKTKLENEKNKAIKPEPNPKTGEVPLTIGIANKLIRDKEDKDAKKKEMKEGKLPGAGVGIIKKYPQWKLRPGGGMYPRYKHPKHGEINIDRYGGWMHYDKNNKKVAFYSPVYPDNKFSNAGATSMDFDVYFKLKKLDESISTKNEEKRLYIESIIKKTRIKK